MCAATQRVGLSWTSALVDAPEDRFDVHDGCAVQRLEVRDPQSRSVDVEHSDPVQPDRVRPVRRAGREDAVLAAGGIPARVHLEHVARRAVEPGQHQQLVAGRDPVEPVGDALREHQPRLGRSLVALLGRARPVGERRLHGSDRDEVHARKVYRGAMASEESARDLVSRALGQEVVATTQAAWGFQNRTDIVTLAGGERVVLQRYRRREDAEYRLRGMRALSAAPVAMPDVRAADLDADPAWAIFAALPGVPAPEADATATLARPMGELLAAIQRLPTAGV